MIEYVSPYETPFGKWLFYLTWMFLPLLPWLLMSIIWQYPIPPLEFFSRLVSGSHDPPADPTWGFVLERATLQGLALTSGAILLLVWFLVELMYIPLRYICGVECCGAEVGDPGCCEERDKAQLEGFCFGCLFKTCKKKKTRPSVEQRKASIRGQLRDLTDTDEDSLDDDCSGEALDRQPLVGPAIAAQLDAT